MQPLFVHKCVREKYEWVAYTTTNKKNKTKTKVKFRKDMIFIIIIFIIDSVSVQI